MYSRMDQVKFVKESLLISFTSSILEYIASTISNMTSLILWSTVDILMF